MNCRVVHSTLSLMSSLLYGIVMQLCLADKSINTRQAASTSIYGTHHLIMYNHWVARTGANVMCMQALGVHCKHTAAPEQR